ncbi:hypothetical protein JCM11251_000652 [Rhodosporidiobolus azoricus]
MASPSPALLLHSISSTLLLPLLLPLLLHSPRLFRAGRQRVFFLVSSALCVALSGLTGLVSLGRGSRGAAVVGGVGGALAVALGDVHVLLILWNSEKDEKSSKPWKSAKVALAGVLSVFVLAAMVLHVALLCLDAPSHTLLLAIAMSRSVVHILFDLLTIALLGFSLSHALKGQTSRLHNTEDPLKARRIGDSYDVWRTTTYDQGATTRAQAGRTRLSALLLASETRLIAIQILAVLLDVLSVSLPIKENYLTFSSSSSRAVPILYGTTISPAGHLVVAVFDVVRWTSMVSEAASTPSSSLSAPSKSSLAVHYHRTPTPSPSTAPLAPNSGETPLSSPTSTRRPSTSMSRMLSDVEQSPLASRAVSPWSMSPVEQESDLGEISGFGARRMRSLSPSPPRPAGLYESKKRDRQPSLVSFLSLGRSHPSSVNETTEQAVQVQTIELQHPYYHTETQPVSHRHAEGEGEAEDLIVVSTPAPVSPRNRTSTFSKRKSPPPVTPPSFSAQHYFSVEASPTTAQTGGKRSSSSLSGISPLLLHRRELESAHGIVSHTSFNTSSPPPSPEQLRYEQATKRTSGISLSEPSTPTANSFCPADLVRPYPHASSSSGATAYYSLPRSPPPLVLPPSASLPLQQSSPKKLRRPSLGRLSSFGSSGAVTPNGSAGGGSESPTRTRSGSVGSLLRTLRRESTTPSLSIITAEGGGSLAWDVEPNEEEDDPFAPVPVGGEGKRQEERVRGWEREREKRRSSEALAGFVEGGVETVLERSEETEENEEIGIEAEDTGSIVDYGEEVERVSTPVALAAQYDFFISAPPSPSQAAPWSSSSPGTTRPRAASQSSSVFVEHLDDDHDFYPPSPSPPHLTHSTSAGALGRAFGVEHVGAEGGRSAPGLSHAHSFATLPQTPTKRSEVGEEASTSSCSAAGERFAKAFRGDAEKDIPSTSPRPQAAAPTLLPVRSTASTRLSSPHNSLKRITASRRPSLTALSPASAPPTSNFTRRISSSATSTSPPSLFSSASFKLRKLRLRASFSVAASPAGPPSRTSSGSELSFACRGTSQSPSRPEIALEVMEPLPRSISAAHHETVGHDGLESISTQAQTPSCSGEQQDGVATVVGAGRSTWWRKLPGSRPSAHYRRASTPLPRSASSAGGSSFPSFLHISTTSSSESSHELNLSRRSNSLRLTPLAAFQLEHPASISPFGSFILPSSTRSSSDKPQRSSTPRESLEAASSAYAASRSQLAVPALASETPIAEPAQLGEHKSAATSRRSFVTARTGGEDGGTIEEDHLSDLDELVRTFSPDDWPQDQEWSTEGLSHQDTVDNQVEATGSSLEFPEQSFASLRDEEDEGDGIAASAEDCDVTFHSAVVSSIKMRRHSAPHVPFPSLPCSTTIEGNVSPTSVSGTEFSPRSPASSFGSMGLAEQDYPVSPVTPASFSS